MHETKNIKKKSLFRLMKRSIYVKVIMTLTGENPSMRKNKSCPSDNSSATNTTWGTRWRSWLRHCATTGRSRVRFPMFSLKFFINIILPACYGPGVDSASNRNEYQEYLLGGKGGRCVGLTTLPPSCADSLEVWEPQSSGTLRACPGL